MSDCKLNDALSICCFVAIKCHNIWLTFHDIFSSSRKLESDVVCVKVHIFSFLTNTIIDFQKVHS